MSYPINYPTPQGANIQLFVSGRFDVSTAIGNTTGNVQTWNKPQGASFVWFTLIGGGGGGGDATSDGTATAQAGGGATGTVSHLLIPAFLIPDQLEVLVADGARGGGPSPDGQATSIRYRTKGTTYTLLNAPNGGRGANATASGGVANDSSGGNNTGGYVGSAFTAAGIFQSVDAVSGANGGASNTTPTTTFLQAGPGGNGVAQTGAYGYRAPNVNGYSMFQPIINSLSTAAANANYGTTTLARAIKVGFGSGGGGAATSGNNNRNGLPGGPGLAVIISW